MYDIYLVVDIDVDCGRWQSLTYYVVYYIFYCIGCGVLAAVQFQFTHMI